MNWSGQPIRRVGVFELSSCRVSRMAVPKPLVRVWSSRVTMSFVFWVVWVRRSLSRGLMKRALMTLAEILYLFLR